MPDPPPPIGAWISSPAGAANTSTPVVRFRVWAPEHSSVDLVVLKDNRREIRPMVRDDAGYWGASYDDLRPGDRYKYRLGGDDARVFPDPASRYQPEGVHGPSEIVDHAAFRWTDHDWHPPRRDELVIYELHVGTFSPSGTFRGAAERLPYLAQLGVRAIELMPVADFPGARNWGYDGVALFAPSRAYGRPEDLQALVDAAHQHGIAVLLDVVYNHLGPDGAYANAFSRHYFTDRHRSPWGQGVNLDGEYGGEVRAFFVGNAVQWIRDYHIDGLRLDATHALQDESPRHFVDELNETVRACSRRAVLMYAEDHRNLAQLVLPRRGGGWDLDGVWADDFHHQVRVHVAGDREAYYRDFSGTTADIARTIEQGWFYTGQHAEHHGRPRGTDPAEVELPRFVVCVQNHDQIGNRADGARLNHQVDAATFRAVSALLLTIPETPLIFQGQEWATAAPFLFFTDHNQALGHEITRGRREEFASFAAFADPARRERIPDPQGIDTFERSRLPWQELESAEHASTLRLYQRLIGLRATFAPLRATTRGSIDLRVLDAETILVERRSDTYNGGIDRLWIAVRLRGSGAAALPECSTAHVLLTTEDPDVAVDPVPVEIEPCGERTCIRFSRPGAVLLHAVTPSDAG